MFKLDQVRTFKAKVPIPVPGQPKDAVIDLEFIFKNRDEIKNYLDSMTPPEGQEPRKDEDILQEIVCGWKDVDADFSPETFTLLLINYPGAAKSIWNKYVSEVMVCKTKN